MPADDNGADYARLAEQELALAKAATDPAVKARHLNLAAEYATKRELTVAPHRKEPGEGA